MKKVFLALVATLAMLSLVACGGGGSNNTTTTQNPANPSVNINIGDATSDRLLAFEVNVSSIVLNGTTSTGNLLAAPAKVELTHLSGKFEPLVLKNVPAGTYNSATIQLTGIAEAVIIPVAGGLPVKKDIPAPASPFTVTFTSVTVGSSPSILNLDFNLGLMVNVNADVVSFASPMPANAVTIVVGAFQANENEQENENGEIEDIHGVIASKDSSSFTLNVGATVPQLKFTVDANTQCSDGAAGVGTACLNSLTVGMAVKVEGRTAADGTLIAREVEGAEDANGLEAEGIIVSVSPATGAATSLTLVVHDASSAAAASSQPQTNDTITVNLASNAQFRVDSGSGKTKISGSTPLFDATHIGKGQKVEADDDVARTNNLQAKKIKLKKQAFIGTWTVSGSNVTLALDANSFFVQLNPTETSIKIVNAAAAIVKGTAPANGTQKVRVRGLLFFDPAAATGSKFTLVAGRIDAVQ